MESQPTFASNKFDQFAKIKKLRDLNGFDIVSLQLQGYDSELFIGKAVIEACTIFACTKAQEDKMSSSGKLSNAYKWDLAIDTLKQLFDQCELTVEDILTKINEEKIMDQKMSWEQS